MSYVRNAWYVACWEQDLAPDTPFAITILGERIVLYRAQTGRLVALEDRCVHRLAPLSLGRCEGERLRCMYHGLLFDPDGSVVEIPGQEKIPDRARVRSYAIMQKHSWVWVWMGDPALADEALIPPAVGFDNPDYILGRGHPDYEAEARLINDNLLDFSHLSFVHAGSFGASESWARNRPKVSQIDRGVRVDQWAVAEPGIGGPADRWTTYDFFIPGILLMTGGSFPLGTAEALAYEAPDLAMAVRGVTFTSQAVTPTGERSARYFFSWGPRRDMGDEKLRDTLMAVAAKAFAEDKAMIEGQQRVIADTANPQVMPFSADKGVTLYNRLVERLARQEDEAARSASAQA